MNKKIIIEFYNTHYIKVCFVLCAIILTVFFFNELSYIGSVLIFNIGYPASRFVVDKNIFFIACPIAICVTLLLYEAYQDHLVKIIMALLVYSLLECMLIVFSNTISVLDPIIKVANFGIIPILLFYPGIKLYHWAIDYKYTKYIILVIASLVTILPFFVGNHLNSESYLQPDYFQSLKTPEKKISIEFFLERPEDIIAFNERITRKNGLGFNQEVVPFRVEKISNSQVKIIVAIGNDLSSYCYFGKITTYEAQEAFNTCIQELKDGSKNTIFVKRNYINNLPAINSKIQNSYIKKIDEFLGNKKKWDIRNDLNLLKIMLVRGGVFHHYDSIMDGVNDVGATAFYNQYGLGPTFLVKMFANLFHTTFFDAIFYSIVFTNIFILVVVIGLFGLDITILFGYISAILSVFFVYNAIAPFLYFSRFLPVTLLVIIYAKYGIKGLKCNALSFIECLLLLVIGIYNKEYALFTIVAITMTGLFTKDYKFCLRSLFIIFPLIVCYCVIPHSHVHGANFTALFSGVGFDITPKPDLVFVISLLAFSFGCIKFCSVNNKSLLFILLLLNVFACKYILMTSLNHFGVLFFYLFLLVYLIQKSTMKANRYIIYFPFFCTLILICLATPNLKYLFYEKKFDKIEYTQNNISDRFYIDKQLIHLGASLESFGLDKYCIIAQQDDFLKIFTKKYITANATNISTNINFPIDAYHLLDNYQNCKYIVVENSLLKNELDNFLLEYAYNRDKNLNGYIIGYIKNRNILKTFIKMSIKNRNFAFENKEFTVYQ